MSRRPWTDVSAVGLRRAALARIVRPASIAFCGALPVLALVLLFVAAIQDDTVAFDLRPIYRAADAVRVGESPYPDVGEPLDAVAAPYVYPPLPAIGAMPLTVLPFEAAGLLVMAALVLGVLATLATLGIRDWRLYGLALLWPPVLSAIQTGNVTIALGLCAALVWRYRDRPLVASAGTGFTLAVKLFFWPLVVWLAATRRIASAVLALVVGGGLLLASWAVIGFTGLLDYPDLLRRLEDTVGADSYTLYIAALDAGAAPGLARGVWLAAGLGILAAVWVFARRGDERSAFILAIVASLSLTPIVWLHYFSLLLVVVAIAQPRMGIVWFVPFALVLTPGSGQPTPFETSWTLAAAAVTFGLALRASRAAVASGVRPVASDPQHGAVAHDGGVRPVGSDPGHGAVGQDGGVRPVGSDPTGLARGRSV